MRILFLDDSPERHRKTEPLLIGHDVTWTWTAPEAISARDGPRFDIAMLDHDLGGRVYTHDEPPSPEGTGQDVATFIAQKMPGNRQPRYVVIHSFNGVGSMLMYYALEGNGYRYGENLVRWPWLTNGRPYPHTVTTWLAGSQS
jgi:hypothetical protein